MIHGDRVYVTVGQDPEQGEGDGRVWCIDATKRLDGSDVSSHLVVDRNGRKVEPRRVVNLLKRKESHFYSTEETLSASKVGESLRHYLKYYHGLDVPLGSTMRSVAPGAEWEIQYTADGREGTLQIWKRRQVGEDGEIGTAYRLGHPTGERIIDNPLSAAIWKYEQFDHDGNGKIEFHEQMHRSISSVVIEENLLFAVDFAGLVHCLDLRTGRAHWTCDLLASSWGTPLLADGRLFVPDEDGDLAIFRLSSDPAKAGLILAKDKPQPKQYFPANEIAMVQSRYGSPCASDGVLYLLAKDRLFAIGK